MQYTLRREGDWAGMEEKKRALAKGDGKGQLPKSPAAKEPRALAGAEPGRARARATGREKYLPKLWPAC